MADAVSEVLTNGRLNNAARHAALLERCERGGEEELKRNAPGLIKIRPGASGYLP